MIRFELRLSPQHATALFAGVVQVNLVQIREAGMTGQAPVLRGLHAGAALRRAGVQPKTPEWGRLVELARAHGEVVPIFYEPLDPNEHVKDWLTVLADGFGDCDDLAPAVAAELLAGGLPAVPISYEPKSDLWHVVVGYREAGEARLIDPSRLGGMD